MRRFGVPLLLLAMTVSVLWKLVLTRQYTYLDSPDLAYQVAPALQVQAFAWQHGTIPLLWDPYRAGGQSLIGLTEPAVAFPLNWILFLMPLRAGFIQQIFLHWYMVLVHFFAALAAYVLCRGLGRSRAASTLGACAYSFAGYVASTWWPQQVQMTIFAPLALLFSLRAIGGERVWRNAFFSGFFLGLMWLGGHHQIPIFTALAICGIWVFHIARGKTVRVKLDRAALLVSLGIVMIAAGALQLFPSYSYGREALRWVGASHPVTWDQTVPYSVHEDFSQPAFVLFGVFLNGFANHSNPFLGCVVFALAILALVLAWNELAVRVLAFVALGGLLFSLGGQTLLHSILYATLPMVEKARSPSYAMFIFQLAVCPLAAFGADRVMENPLSNWPRMAAYASAVAGIVIFLFAIHIEVQQMHVNWQLYSAPITAMAAILLAVLLATLRNGAVEPRRAGVFLILLVMLEIGSFAGLGMTNRDKGWEFWPVLQRDRDVALFLRTRPGPFRVEAKEQDVPYAFGDWYGIESYMSYAASGPERFLKIVGETSTRRLLGVRYYIAKAPANPEQHEVFAGANGIKVFETQGAMPRAWAVHQVSSSGGGDPAVKMSAIDIARTTFVPGDAPPLETCDEDRVQIAQRAPEFVAIDAAMNCRGMVILGESYSNDWVATIDGKSAPIYAAYSFIRGVVAERGQHHIEFRYRPSSVYWGALLTFACFAVALVLAFR